MENLIKPISFINKENYCESDNFIYLQGEVFRYIIANNNYYQNYMISNYGRIYSVYSNMILKNTEDKDGYLFIRLNNKQFRVHRLVLMTFCPIENSEDFQVNHYDGNKQNNCLWNLYWCTNQENIDHAISQGLSTQKGESHHATYLTNEQVHFICKCLEDGMNYRSIYDLLNINVDYIKIRDIMINIINGKNWLHISKDYNITKIYQHHTVYDEKIIRMACEYLQQGKSYDKICNLISDVSSPNLKRFKRMLYDITSGAGYKYISNDYNIIIPDNIKAPLFIDEQIHYICKGIRDGDDSNTILLGIGIDLNKMDKNKKHCIINCISNIKRKKSFAQISNGYF